VLRADGATLSSIAIQANDTDPDGDALTVTIDDKPPIGTVTVNTNGTVKLDGLPGDFKGVTTFSYHIADPAGLTSAARSAVFVGVDPFRVLFVGDASSNGSNEVYLENFASTPTAVTAATEGTMRLKGFIASENGTTVAYRRVDTGSPSTSDLSFVRTATPSQQLRIPLASGTSLAQDVNGNDQYRVSPDGQWIVFIASDGSNATAAYAVNVSSAAIVTKVTIAGAQYVTKPQFSRDSKSLYLLASPSTNGANRTLYAFELGTSNIAQISAPNAAASADDVLDYTVASDQSRILILANRLGRPGLYYIDPSHLQTEVQVSHSLALTESLNKSTLPLPPARGGSTLNQRVAYLTQNLITFGIYIAGVSATPNPHVVTSASQTTELVGLRPDDAALVYSRGGQVYEAVLDSGTTDQTVGVGSNAWYDSTGNIVVLKQFLPYPSLAVTTRSTFGTTKPLGTTTLAAHYIDVSGADRGVVVIGEGSQSGSAPTSARLALVNAQAPDKLLYFVDFPSPLELTSPSSQVVSN
jgi:Tol biopolymer transport system component